MLQMGTHFVVFLKMCLLFNRVEKVRVRLFLGIWVYVVGSYHDVTV